jgi:hypothetical protein
LPGNRPHRIGISLYRGNKVPTDQKNQPKPVQSLKFTQQVQSDSPAFTPVPGAFTVGHRIQNRPDFCQAAVTDGFNDYMVEPVKSRRLRRWRLGHYNLWRILWGDNATQNHTVATLRSDLGGQI